MIATKRSALFAVAAAALLVFSPNPATAQANRMSEDAPPLQPAQLLELFEANYTPSSALLDAAWALDTMNTSSAAGHTPSFSFTQRAAWSQYSYWTLDLNLAATVPLYRSRAQPLGALRNQRAMHLDLNYALAYEDARTNFLRDALALSRLRELAALVDEVMTLLPSSGWRAPESAAAVLDVPLSQREEVSAYWQTVGLKRYLDTTLPELEQRVAARIGLHMPVQLASFEQLVRHVVPRAPTIQQCVQGSPLLEEVRTLHRVQNLERAAQQSLDIRVDLTGTAAYTSGHLVGMVGIEARVPLPSAWPVSGQLAAAANLAGAEQTVRLSWPAVSTSPSRPLSEAERVERQEAQVRAVELELKALVRSIELSSASELAAEAQLLWALSDLFSLTNLDDARARATNLTGDLATDLYLVRLNSDLAFAQISHVETLLGAAAACGAGG